MVATVRLDRKTEALMNRLVRRTGRSRSQVIREAIEQLAQAEGAGRPAATAYEAMEHAFGCWDSGGARLSERTGERFRALLTDRLRKAHPSRASQRAENGRARRRAHAASA